MKQLFRTQHGHYSVRMAGPWHPNDKYILEIADPYQSMLIALDRFDLAMIYEAVKAELDEEKDR